MTNTTNAPATPFNFEEKFPTLEAAQAATKAADLANFKISRVVEGEWIVVDMKGKAQASPAPKAAPKAASKGKGAKAAKGGRKSVEGRQAAQKADAQKAKAEKGAGDEMARFAEQRKLIGKAGKLSERRWIGPWQAFEASAKAGKLPDAMGAKAERKDLFGGIFAAETHRPFEKRILALAALIRAKDEKGLKALQVKEISTTPIMLGKLRDLALAALQAKAEKPAKANGKAKAPPVEAPAEAQAPTS
jgi:hypothetical protein